MTVTIDEQPQIQGVAPADIISDGLSPGLEIIVQKFENGEYFLPELMLCGNIMKNALDKIRPHMVTTGSKLSGNVLLGTAEGDIHHIWLEYLRRGPGGGWI